MKPEGDTWRQSARSDSDLCESGVSSRPCFTIKERIVKDDGRYLIFYRFAAQSPTRERAGVQGGDGAERVLGAVRADAADTDVDADAGVGIGVDIRVDGGVDGAIESASESARERR